LEQAAVRKPSLDSLARLLWALTLVTLPVTSFRFMPFMGAGTFVRPLALYPLALLLPLLLYQMWSKRLTRPWNGALTILLAFTLTALLATAFGSLLAPIQLRGVTYWDRALRAWVTLVIGLSFFAAAAWMNRSEDDLKFSVKWLLAGLALHILWGGIQALGLRLGLRGELNEIQTLFSVRGLPRNRRIAGFAYEPSWLAAQLTALYFPWLFASWLAKYRLTRFKWLEALLFGGGLIILLLTYSRSGVFVTVGAMALTFMVAGAPLRRDVANWYRAGFHPPVGTGQWRQIQAAASRIALTLLLLGAAIAAATLLANKGYIAALWNSSAESLWDYAIDAYFGPRLAYAVAAWEAFQSHPLSGVGLGASGFRMYAHIPDWALSGVPEIAQQLSPSSNLYPNPKNLFIRLLAETGLPGFLLYLSFLLTLLAKALKGLKQSDRFWRFVGAAGFFSVVAIAAQGISQDSFALPEMWLNLGILAGVVSFALESEPLTPHPSLTRTRAPKG
jgi:O-antigen ligase